MAQNTPDLNLSITIEDAHKRSSAEHPDAAVIWHPLDALFGAVVTSGDSLPSWHVESLAVRLEGWSRIWIQTMTEKLDPIAYRTSHRFLCQSQDLPCRSRDVHDRHDTREQRTPFAFIISGWTITRNCIPQQFLDLPPSFRAGLTHTSGSERFGQPSISYALVAVAQLRSLDDPLQIQTIEERREIRISPANLASPPICTGDFPDEFTESASHAFKPSRFSKTAYPMTLSTHEPPAIRVPSPQTKGHTTLPIAITVDSLQSDGDQHNSGALQQLLKNLKFTVKTYLRTKTFYSWKPFSQVPSQTVLSVTGDVRLLDEMMVLSSLTVSRPLWQGVEVDRSLSYSDTVRRPSPPSVTSRQPSVASTISEARPQRQWCSTLEIPVETPSDLIPTFCSAFASRQYSLRLSIRVSGVSVDKYILEVPLQLGYSPIENGSRSPTIGTSEQTMTLSREERRNLINFGEQLPAYPGRVHGTMAMT